MGITNNIPPSRLIQPGVVDNAAARPASPFEGQAVYQKDTDAVLVWNGTAWYPNWNMPWGIVSIVSNGATTISLPSATETTLLTAPAFTAVTGRLYRIVWQEPEIYGGTGNMQLKLKNGATILVNKTYSGGGIYYAGFVTFSQSFTAGSVTVSGTATAAVTGSSYRGSGGYIAQLSVEDIGPA